VTKPLLIAAGNRWRRDDGIGAEIVEQLGVLLGDRVDTLHLSGEGAGLIDAWRDRDAVWLFDAAAAAGHPGRITRIAAHREPVPAELCHHSTHRFGVAEAIEMARVLDQLPDRLLLITVEGAHFGEGPGTTETVSAAGLAVAEEIAATVESDATGSPD